VYYLDILLGNFKTLHNILIIKMSELLKIDLKFNLENYDFDSGNNELNEFLFKESKSFLKEDYCQIYILKEENNSNIIGYISISCCHVEFHKDFIDTDIKIRYIPSLLIGKLAIDKKFRRQYYGTDLLKYATHIGLEISQQVGCRLLIVDVLTNTQSINFYKKFKFDYVFESIGKSVEDILKKNQKCERDTIKMYFDLSSIKKTTNP